MQFWPCVVELNLGNSMLRSVHFGDGALCRRDSCDDANPELYIASCLVSTNDSTSRNSSLLGSAKSM